MHVYEVTPGIYKLLQKLIPLVTSVNSNLKLVTSVEWLYVQMASKPVTKVSRLGLRSIIKARVSHSIFYQIQKNLFVNSGNNFITLFIVYCSVKIVFVLYSIQRIVFYYDVFAAVCLGLKSYLNLSLQICYIQYGRNKTWHF